MAEKPTGGAAPAASEKKISKMEAVRRAIATLGQDAGRAAIRDEVKRAFGIEMSADHVSTYKGDIAREAAKKKLAAKKPTATKPVATKPAAVVPAVEKAASSPKKPATAPSGNGNGPSVALGDILTLKELVDRVGAENVLKLIGVMAR
jgi:hypothetical protein